MGTFWNKPAGTAQARPANLPVAVDGRPHRPVQSPSPPPGLHADLPARAMSSAGSMQGKRLGVLPGPRDSDAAETSKSVRQVARDAADVFRIMRRRPLPSMVGLAMDVRDIVSRGPAPRHEVDATRALEVLQDPELAKRLETPPIYVRPVEEEGENQHAFELGRRFADQGGRVPLRQALDEKQRYLWIMTAPKAPGDAPGIHIGVEYPEQDAKGRTDKMGHPSILNKTLGTGPRHGAIFAGELVHENGRWVMDNNSGRWFGSNAPQLAKLGLHKRDLFAAAAHHINEMSDLDLRDAKQFSRNPLRFVEQLVGLHPPKAVSLLPIKRP